MDLVEDDFPLEECKIPPGKMLLMQDARSLYVVESGGNYYFWNEITDEVYVIVQPLALPQILKLLEEGKMPVYRHRATSLRWLIWELWGPVSSCMQSREKA